MGVGVVSVYIEWLGRDDSGKAVTGIPGMNAAQEISSDFLSLE